MPPRYAYWTILAGGLPTAFRAVDRDELMPTFQRLREKHPDAEMKWFARGKLWNSPEEARGARDDRGPARPRGAGEEAGRGRDWRPGGSHRDPRQPFIDAKKARNQDRRKERFERRQRAGNDERAPEQEPRPRRREPSEEWRSRPPQGGGAATRPRFDRESGDRPFRPKGPTDGRSGSWKDGGAKPGGGRDSRGPGGRDGMRPPQSSWQNREDRGPRPPKADWQQRPDRGPRPPKADWQQPPDRGARPPKADWQHRSDRGPRPPKADWQQRSNTGPRPPRTEWRDRPGPGPRDDRGTRPSKPEGFRKGPRPEGSGKGHSEGRPPKAREERPRDDGRRSFDRSGFERRHSEGEPPQPPRPRGPNREPRPSEDPKPSPPPRPREPEVAPPGPPERGGRKRSPRS